jgi:hypothetical protein
MVIMGVFIRKGPLKNAGIEPSTPAFSGLGSPKAIRFKTSHLAFSGVPNFPNYWDMNGTRHLAGRNCLSHSPFFVFNSALPEITSMLINDNEEHFL